MKAFRYIAVIGLLASFAFVSNGPAKKYPKGLLENPATLADLLANNKQAPVILNIGFLTNNIKDAIHIGPASTSDGLMSFKAQLINYSKDQPIVIYCGCCALGHCPNVGPALAYALDQGYTNVKVLDLKENLKVDWISKGYPMN